MSPLFRSPLLHFLVLGALLHVAQGLRWGATGADENAVRPIAIETDRLLEMQTAFAEQTGRRPNPAETQRMIDAEVDEEILFREAISRGLLERDPGVQTRLIQKMIFLDGKTELDDPSALLARAVDLGLQHDDIVVRRILVQKMKLLGSSLHGKQIPTAEEIRAVYDAEGEELRAPERRSLTHVFLSSDRHAATTRTMARQLLARLRSAPVPSGEAPTLGDPFPLGHQLEHRSQSDLERSFGARFGEEAFALDIGRWSDPIASAYGQHLIWIDDVTPGEIPPLAQVSDRLRLKLEEDRRRANLAALVSDLRTRYPVVFPTSHQSGRDALDPPDTRESVAPLDPSRTPLDPRSVPLAAEEEPG